MVRELSERVIVNVNCSNLECNFQHEYVRKQGGLLVCTLPGEYSWKIIYDRLYRRTPEDEKVDVREREVIPCPKCSTRTWTLEVDSSQAARLENAFSEARCYSFKEMFTEGELEKSKKPTNEVRPRMMYLDVEFEGSPAYAQLRDEVNWSFDSRAYTATIVLLRKLIENLIVDLLRTRFGLDRVDLFFIKSQRRFRNLSELIETLRNKIKEFEPYGLEEKHLRILEQMREEGNTKAHSIVDHGTKGDLMNLRATARKGIIALFTTWRNIAESHR